MVATNTSVERASKRRLSSPDQLMLWGLALSAVFEFIWRVIERPFDVSNLFLAAIYLVSAALVWTGWRWIFLAPLAFITLAVVGGLLADGLSPFIRPATHWGDFEQWTVELPLLGLFIFAGSVKIIQIIRRRPLQLPVFTPYLIGAVIGFALGGNLLAIVNR
jgi:hypothetical protein